MKRKIIGIMVFIIVYNLYASPEYLNKLFFHTDEYAKICILEDKIIFDDEEEGGNLYCNNTFDSFKGNNHNYIILHTTVLDSYFVHLIKCINNPQYYYSCWEITYAKTSEKASYNRAKLVPFKVLRAESFITEKDKKGKEIIFFPDDLFSLDFNPWAVTENDKKMIYLSTKRWRNSNTQYLSITDIIFVNGFVYPDKEYLYEQNSRVKGVRISYNDISFDTQLRDTGNFQVVHLPAPINPTEDNSIKIEIIDSYPGTKYSDIVMSGVYYMDATID